MHFKDDPISDMHARNYLIILCLKHFPGPTKFGPVFWSRLFRCGPVEYNYPAGFPTRVRVTHFTHSHRLSPFYFGKKSRKEAKKKERKKILRKPFKDAFSAITFP